MILSAPDLRRILVAATQLSAKSARTLVRAVLADQDRAAAESAKPRAIFALHVGLLPNFRRLYQILQLPDVQVTEQLRRYRAGLALDLATLNADLTFALRFEDVLAQSMAAGLTADAAVKASNLEEILDRSGRRRLLPTSMSSDELRQLATEIRTAAIFSARTTNAEYLAVQAKTIDEYIAGRINLATARTRLKLELDRLGYTPGEGFPGMPGVPSAEAGSLQDLSSDRRIKLILDTQAELAFGKGQEISGLETMDVFPAWELVRWAPRANVRNWEKRWAEAGGDFTNESPRRMIALKTDAIWAELGSSARFADALDTTHPPFAFNSGMGWRAVARSEAESLGLAAIPPTDLQTQPQPTITRPPLDRSDFPPDLLQQLEADLARLTAEAEASLARDIAEANRRYNQQ